MLVLEGLVGLHSHSTPDSLSGWGIDLNYCDIECFAWETNRDHSVTFEIAPNTAFQTLVDCEAYSISSKGFLPTVVDIIVI